MNNFLLIAFLSLTTCNTYASTYCNGKINAIYKWAEMTRLSIQIETQDGIITPWINLPTKSDEALALTAFATGKPIELYWYATDVTACANGWVNNRALSGYFTVRN